MFEDTDVGSLASGVGCDHVLAVLEDDLSSGELASDCHVGDLQCRNSTSTFCSSVAYKCVSHTPD